jgi:hypothetical protein
MIRTLQRSHSYLLRMMVLFASALHLLWAFLLVYNPDSIGATAIKVFTDSIDIAGTAVAFSCVALWAIIGIVTEEAPTRWWRAVFLSPQQMVLTISAIASMTAVLSGSYADGTERSWSFILADQAPHILLALFYFLSLLCIIHYDLRTHVVPPPMVPRSEPILDRVSPSDQKEAP